MLILAHGPAAAKPDGHQALPDGKAGAPTPPTPHAAGESGSTGLMAALLDELALGLILLEADGRVRHVNRTARLPLDPPGPIVVEGLALRAQDPDSDARLQAAIAQAAKGRRSLVRLAAPGGITYAGLAPLRQPHDDERPLVLLMLGRTDMGSALALDRFAAMHLLTPTEQSVLTNLCQGHTPKQIADAGDVQICTVRSQLLAIREKVGARDLRHLMRLVAGLPPAAGLALQTQPTRMARSTSGPPTGRAAVPKRPAQDRPAQATRARA